MHCIYGILWADYCLFVYSSLPKIPPFYKTTYPNIHIPHTHNQSLLRINNPPLRNLKRTFTLGQRRRIKDLTHPLLPLPLPKVQPRRRRMRQHMPPNRFLRIRMCHRITRISHHLIRHEDGNIELLSELHDAGENLAEDLLALGELAAAGVVVAEAGHDGVDDEEGVRGFEHEGGGHVEQGDYVLDGIALGVFYVLEGLLGVQAEALGDLYYALRAAVLKDIYKVFSVSM